MHLLWSPAADASVRALAVLLRSAQVHLAAVKWFGFVVACAGDAG
jgi:hypothetical protein